MALKKVFASKAGVNGEYVNFDISFKDKTTVLLRMNYWKDEATRNTVGAIPLNDQLAGGGDDRITGFQCLYEFSYDLASALNVYQQGYDYLKTLSEFADAEDC